ncbi:MAG: hypothetical protein ACP5RI_01625 [Candidatus Micrarchaeia archaeon]
MPIKYNLTKFDVLSNKIKKIAQSKNHEWNDEEFITVAKAVIIASFASGHSWHTYKTIMSNKPFITISYEEMDEYNEAKNNRWKMVTPFDVVEVANLNINDNIFKQWLYSCVDKKDHETYLNAWEELKKEFNDACDDVPKKEF